MFGSLGEPHLLVADTHVHQHVCNQYNEYNNPDILMLHGILITDMLLQYHI